MKKFFIKLAAAVGCLVLVLVPISAYNKSQIDRKVKNALQLSDSISVIAVGHSHIECSLDPNYFPEMVNRAKSSEGRLYSISKARFYLENNPHLKCVILPWSFFNAGGGLNFREEDNYDPFRIYFPLLVQSNRVFEYLNNENIGYFVKHYISNKFGLPAKSLINGVFHDSMRNSSVEFVGGFLSEFKASIEKDDLRRKVGSLGVNVDDQYLSALINIHERESLDNFLSICKATNVNVIIFNAPTHRDYNNAIDSRIKSKMNEWANETCSKYGMHYIDWHDYYLPDSMFRDYNHINTEGAKVVTPMLRDTLMKLGCI
ncbi:MAG: D-alanyl-lipoteichoic acid biosynthesis protein DltD [Bacteroidales bacterium]